MFFEKSSIFNGIYVNRFEKRAKQKKQRGFVRKM
jgi:hypothetical protein